MITIISTLIGAIVGFIAGALVFRNNASKAEGLITKAKQDVQTVQNAVDTVKNNK